MIDGHIKKDDWGQTGSLEPQFTDDCTTRHDFSEEVKFVAARTQERYFGIDETRALMLTREYLFDLYTARDERPHSYVWLVHSFGSAIPDQEDRWRSSNELATLVKELSNVRTRNPSGEGWSVTVHQTPPKDAPEDSPLDESWWSRNIGVRIRMLGQEGAKTHLGATPKPAINRKRPEELPWVDGVTVVASLEAPSAVFAALPEPFEDSPQVGAFERIAQTHDALAVRVAGGEFDDRLMVRFGPQSDQPVTLAGDKESFAFAGHVFIRRDERAITVRGDLHEMMLHVGDARPKLIVNGRPAETRVQDGCLQWKQ
jgi:hypothetical protein